MLLAALVIAVRVRVELPRHGALAVHF
jgi:hypothetical protein